MHSNYLDWEKAALEQMENLKSLGFIVEKVEIDVDEVLEWCKKRNIPFNGKSRSKYTAEMVRKNDQAKKRN